MFLGLHIIVDGIGLGSHVILLAVAETVNGEVGLQRVASRELVDTAHVPAQALVTHLIVGAAGDVSARFGAVGDFVGVVNTGIERQMFIGCIGELLAHEIGAITREERGNRRLSFGLGALDILHIIDAVAVGLVARERGIGAEAVFVNIQGDVLGQLAMARHACVASHTHQISCGLVGDNVDDTGNGV